MALVAQNTAASGLDVTLKFQGQLFDPVSPSEPSYVITEPLGTVVGSGVGFKRSTGIYDARGTVIPSGFDLTQAWKIAWTATSPVGVPATKCEEFSVVGSLSFDFSKIDDIVSLVKLDLNLTNEFIEDQYRLFVTKALNRLNRCLCFTGTANELSLDTTTGAITPAPNSEIQDFIVMQVECLIVKRDNKIAIGRGIRVRDGETEIDTTAGFGGFRDFLQSVCGELDDACQRFLKKQDESQWADATICGAQNIWLGTMNVCEQMPGGHLRCIRSPFEFCQGTQLHW